MFNSLNKENIIADKNFNRWLVPPAALLIHLSIGMIYGFSVFWKRLTEIVGQQCADNITFFERIFITSCDWKMSDLGWTFFISYCFSWRICSDFWTLARKSRPKESWRCCCACMGRRINCYLLRRLHPPVVDHLARNWCYRRHRTWSRLYFSCFNID